MRIGIANRLRILHGKACACFMLGLTCTAHGQDAPQLPSVPPDPAPFELEVFQGPRLKKWHPAAYPWSEVLASHEGWVYLNFMVDPSGTPYEIVVTESSGNEVFEREAVKAMQRYEFEPATLDGKPVDASQWFKLTFVVNGPGVGASKEYVRTHRKLIEAVQAGQKDIADDELANLKGQNLVELAYAGVAKYEYYRRWGSPAEQLAALEQAIAGEKSPKYLPKDVFKAALQSLLPLQVKSQNFANAATTWKLMQKNRVDPAVLARWQEVMDDLEKLRTDDRSFSIRAEITRRSSWSTELHKKNFQAQVISGKLVEVKLRCDKQYVFLSFDPTIKYRVADKYGVCSLELIGDPGTEFILTQS